MRTARGPDPVAFSSKGVRGCLAVLALGIGLAGRPIEARSFDWVPPAPWRAPPGTLWPQGDAVPTNARIHVRLPAEEAQEVALELDLSHLGTPRRFARDPVAQLARTLTLHSLWEAGRAGPEVPTGWRASIGRGAVTFELAPRLPLAPLTEYVVMMERRGEPQRLGTFRTGLAAQTTPPAWRGIRGARYVASFWPLYLYFSPYPGEPAHGPQARLTIHAATSTREGPLRYGVWLARLEEPLRYQEAPAAWLLPVDGQLLIDLPPDLARVGRIRIGVRAVDAAGNRSPPGETEVAPVPEAR
jgi:hypothetical protein